MMPYRRMVHIAGYLVLLVLVAGTVVAQQLRPRIAGSIDNHKTVLLDRAVRMEARAESDRGAVSGDFVIRRGQLVLKMDAAQEAALDKLVAEQRDPASPNYRRWITPADFAARFGAANSDIEKITGWLRTQGMTNVTVLPNKLAVSFDGTATAVGSAFRTSIHHYNVAGREHYANSVAPSIPAALANVVSTVRGLDDFRPESKSKQPIPNYVTGGGQNYIVPDDVAAIYNIAPLYAAGTDGTGQKIVVVGQSAIDLADIRAYRQAFGLPPNDPQIVLAGKTDPGYTSAQAEADLDLELVGAVARNARIIYVYSPNAYTSAEYAITNNLAPVITMSFGTCEGEPAFLDYLATVAKQANAQGITWIASSGDTGPSGCDFTTNDKAKHGITVQSPASTPGVTAVGGTSLSQDPQFWNSTNSPTGASARGYVPETAWNNTASWGRLLTSGGGASSYYAQPVWQAGVGVPNNGKRNIPDVSFFAMNASSGYPICTQGSCASGFDPNNGYHGGTSASAPIFAGIVALLNQYGVDNGKIPQAGLGNINPALYLLAAKQPQAFHDVTTGDNIVPCEAGSPDCSTGSYGYTASVGYDLVTGLGSVDTNTFVHTLFTIAPASSTTTLQADKQTIVSGESVTLTAKVVADSEAATGQVAFTNGSTTLGTATLDPDGTASLTVPLSTGTATIVAVYSGSLYVNTSTSAAVTVTVTAPVPPDFKLSASKTAISLTAGQNGTVTLTITPENGFEDAVQFSCSGLPAGASCTFSPTSVTPIGAPASVTVTVTTATQTAALRPLPMMFATMLPGVVGLFGVVSNRRKRVMIALAMVIALALLGATVACGGGGATGNNPPQKQPTTTTTPVTITAKSTSVSHTVTVDLSITQ